MINNIISKFTFIKKINIKFAKPLLLLIINFDDIFFKFRIFITNIFLPKKYKIIKKALNELRTNGVAVIENFYSNKEIQIIKYECFQLLEYVEAEKISKNEYISAEPININNITLYLEKLGKSIKLKGLNNINSFFKQIGRKLENNIITLVYQLSLSKPYLVYNVSHDGSILHPVLKDYSKNSSEAIAGKPHVDLPLHQLRAFVALNDVEEENGATVYYKSSMNSELLKSNHLNLFLENFGFDIDNENSHYINNEKLSNLSCERSILKCKKGDLVLIDLKTAHYAVLPKKGERQLLWFYY